MNRTAVDFYWFAYACPFFNGQTEANNGYGCDHSEQEETQNRDGKEQGCCYCCSCPLGSEADNEDLSNPNIDWSEVGDEQEVAEDEYLLIDSGSDASEDQKRALDSYNRWLNRYNFSERQVTV